MKRLMYMIKQAIMMGKIWFVTTALLLLGGTTGAAGATGTRVQASSEQAQEDEQPRSMEGCSIVHILDPGWPNYVFTGDTIKPHLLIYDYRNDTVVRLQWTRDYVFSYSNCVNSSPDSATVTATGIGNYYGSISEHYYIVPHSMSDTAAIKVIATNRVPFTGSGVRPDISVTFQSNRNLSNYISLTEGVDYTVSCDNNVNIGKATFTLTGLGSYGGERTDTFEVVRNVFDSGMVISSIGVQDWTGGGVMPDITVTDRLRHNKVLAPGTDYDIVYANNVDVGWATMFIEGKGEYSGVGMQRFLIYFSAKHLPHVQLNPDSVLAVGLPGTSNTMLNYYGSAGIGKFLNILQYAFKHRPNGKVMLPDSVVNYLIRYNNSDSVVKRLVGDIEPYLQHIAHDEYRLMFALFPGVLETTADADDSFVGNGGIVPPPYPQASIGGIFYYNGTGFQLSSIRYASDIIDYNELIRQIAEQVADEFRNVADNGWRWVRVPRFDNDWLVVDNRIWPECPREGIEFTEEQIAHAQEELNKLRGKHVEEVVKEGAVESEAAEAFGAAAGGALGGTEVVGQSHAAGVVAIGIGVLAVGGTTAALVVHFTKKYDIDSNWVQITDTPMVYSGSPLIPTVSVVENGETLEPNVDYIISCGSNINVGTAQVKVAGTGSSYKGYVTKSFRIVPDTLDTDFHAYIAPRPWTGAEIKPATADIVIWNVSSGDIVSQNYYNVVGYANNTNVSASDDSAIVKIVGTGNYSADTFHAKFAIYAEITAFVREYNRNNTDTVRLYKGSATGTDTMPIQHVAQQDIGTSGVFNNTITISDTNLLRDAMTPYRLFIARPVHLSATVHSITIGDSSIDLRKHSNPDLDTIKLPCGDVNGDNRIDSADYWVLEPYELNPKRVGNNKQDSIYDLNGDGQINHADIGIWQEFCNDSIGYTLPLYIDFSNTTGGGDDEEDPLKHKPTATTLRQTASQSKAAATVSAAGPLIHRADGLEIAIPIQNLMIYDANGQTVYSSGAGTGNRPIPLPKGAYLIYLNNTTYRYVQ